MDELRQDDNRYTPGPQPLRRKKRKRGGQTGNSNACTHGLYSASFSRAEYLEFQELVQKQGMDPELAVIRLKFQKLLETDPLNALARDRIVKMLVRYTRCNCELYGMKISVLRHAYEEALSRFALEVASHNNVDNFDFGELFD